MTAPASFSKRALDVTITLGEGAFGNSGHNTVKIKGLRTEASIDKAGFPGMDRAEIRVYGVRQEVINAVTTLGVPRLMARANNRIVLEAGEEGGAMAVVYNGTFQEAWQDMASSPETALHMVGWGGTFDALTPVPPLSFPGPVDAATIMSGLATRMNQTFENSGVNIQLPRSYYPGTALEQAHAIARDGDFNLYFDSGDGKLTANPAQYGTMAIWPKNGVRKGLIPLISPSTGLIGYPQYGGTGGISFRTLLNPNIRLGGLVKVRSSLGDATVDAKAQGTNRADAQKGGPNGEWTVIPSLVYELSAQVPGGPWFVRVNCARTIDDAVPVK